jgi:hypothetical protein
MGSLPKLHLMTHMPDEGMLKKSEQLKPGKKTQYLKNRKPQ